MTRPLSIIVPHFQKQHHLSQLLRILDSQLCENSEIIVVDDYSPDGLPVQCKKVTVVQPDTPRIEEYRLNHLRNLGVMTAKNDAIIILDPDCHPFTGFIEKASQIFDPSILHGGRIDYCEEDNSITVDRRGKNSGWVYNGFNIYGGCMMFSKTRTELLGWFTDEYNGGWGADDNDFASKCHHSGMRLRYSTELHCMHQHHPKTRPNKDRNYRIYRDKVKQYENHLNLVTPFKPAIGVMIISMERPELIDQAVRGVTRGRIPVKVRLINNGDTSEEQRKALKPWRNRWSIDVVEHQRTQPAKVRNDSLKWAKENKLKYLLMVDDDIVPKSGGVEQLIKVLETHPEVYAVSGYQERGNPPRRQLLGGWFKENGVKHPPFKKQMNLVDTVSGGFTLVRVEPQIYFDESYETGGNDYDWSMIISSHGWKLANTGLAGCYHKYLWTSNGKQLYRNPRDYKKIRYDQGRHKRMADKFYEKWGHRIMNPSDE